MHTFPRIRGGRTQPPWRLVGRAGKRAPNEEGDTVGRQGTVVCVLGASLEAQVCCRGLDSHNTPDRGATAPGAPRPLKVSVAPLT